MRVLFTGSREWDDWLTINETFARLDRLFGRGIAVHGGARGVDLYIDAVCQIWGWRPEVHKPDYARYGRYEAPKRRNLTMLESKPDFVIGFWDGSSTGTFHCLNFAVNIYRIPTLIYKPVDRTIVEVV